MNPIELSARRRPGRPRVRQMPDLRVTIRFRYHCDGDLIRVLDAAPNKNRLVRDALRHWLARVDAPRHADVCAQTAG